MNRESEHPEGAALNHGCHSPWKYATMALQDDGNLVLYCTVDAQTQERSVVWQTGTQHSADAAGGLQ